MNEIKCLTTKLETKIKNANQSFHRFAHMVVIMYERVLPTHAFHFCFRHKRNRCLVVPRLKSSKLFPLKPCLSNKVILYPGGNTILEIPPSNARGTLRYEPTFLDSRPSRQYLLQSRLVCASPFSMAFTRKDWTA